MECVRFFSAGLCVCKGLVAPLPSAPDLALDKVFFAASARSATLGKGFSTFQKKIDFFSVCFFGCDEVGHYTILPRAL